MMAMTRSLPAKNYKRYSSGMRSYHSTTSENTYKPSNRDFIGSFYAILQRWQSETAFTSSPTKKVEHPSYKALVKSACDVTPLIIAELKKNPSPLVWVLDEAYKTQPYLDSDIGDIEAMSKAWIFWVERNGRTL